MDDVDIESAPTEAPRGSKVGKHGKNKSIRSHKNHSPSDQPPDDDSRQSLEASQATAPSSHKNPDYDVDDTKEIVLEQNVITFNPCFPCRCFNLRKWSFIIAVFIIAQSGLHMVELLISPTQEKCEAQVDDICLTSEPPDFADCKEAAIETCDELIEWHDIALLSFCFVSICSGGLLLWELLGQVWLAGVGSAFLLGLATICYWILTGLQFKLAKAINAFGRGKKDQTLHILKGLAQTLVQFYLIACVVGITSQIRAKADELPVEENHKFRQRFLITKYGTSTMEVDESGEQADDAFSHHVHPTKAHNNQVAPDKTDE